jgi:ribulose-5-phosphate 4-epimerase/fuculose-1-phosphate aldolase
VSEYLKFTYERARDQLAPFHELAELNKYRRKLLKLQLIGMSPNGVSFGNLSVRDRVTNNFYVTGSATGALFELTLADCAKVVAYDIRRNWLRYEGAAIPSSESLTHAAVYKSDGSARAIIHCHDSTLWSTLLHRVPTTSKATEYGTPEMACEIIQLFQTGEVHRRKIIVMAGHEGGIVTFGSDLEDAFAVLMQERNETTQLH